ncbi:MAG: DUF5777 family beta-barrel protein [Vicinamibacterales bacterium]
MIRTTMRLSFFAALALCLFPSGTYAQNDAQLNLSQPDFTLVNLPTSLRLPRNGASFRFTHRFPRPLKCEECANSLAADLFGLDEGAVIGLEFRYGLAPSLEVGIARARLGKTVAFFGQYGVVRQSSGMPLEISALAGVEGTNNFGASDPVGTPDAFSPALGVILTRLLGSRGAVYLEPIWVGNSNLLSDFGDDNTFMAGVGARVRVTPTVYLLGELTPRFAGYTPGKTLGSFAVEKRAGGHLFQLNFSNHFGGGTLRQIAEGAAEGDDDWYVGFNISRKFF